MRMLAVALLLACGCAPIGGSGGKTPDVGPTPGPAPQPAPATSEYGKAVDESMRMFLPAMAQAWRDAGKESATNWDEAIAAVRRSTREAREKSFSPLTDRIESETSGEFSESKFRDLCERVARAFEEVARND